MRYGVQGRVFLSAGFLTLLMAVPASSQTGVSVVVDEVTDNRYHQGDLNGSLSLHVKLTGAAAEKAAAARIVVKEAKDDRGTDLGGDYRTPDFTERKMNNGVLEMSLKPPLRTAKSIRVKGSVELFAPARDPNSTVKADHALKSLNTPLSTKGLKSAKISLTPLSREGYLELRKKQKITDKDIAEIRAMGKAHGADDKEIEMAIEMAKAMDALSGDEVNDNSIILSGPAADFARIQSVTVLAADGSEVNAGNRSSSTRGDWTVMVIQPNEKLPADVALQFKLLTDKSKVSYPFELKSVPLP